MSPQIQFPGPIATVFITDQLADRKADAPDFLREKLAIQNLAAVMSDHPDEVLPPLVKLGMEICGAHSAGISILEPEAGQFRWHALAGELATFEGTTTPRNFSPCGVCLDLAEPILMERPERAYDWIRDAGITVPEVLLVPLTVKDSDAIGTLWLVAADAGHFNKEHARVMAELSAFTGMALRTVQTEQRLKLVLQQQETLMREMSHRIKNLFSVADSMVRMTARNDEGRTRRNPVRTLACFGPGQWSDPPILRHRRGCRCELLRSHPADPPTARKGARLPARAAARDRRAGREPSRPDLPRTRD